MALPQEPVRVTEFYTETVLPALAQRLDQAFPEFGWKRDPRGWVATNEQHTHARLGVRAERVVAHGPAPRGFLVHGGQPMLWTAYLNDDTIPRGADFIRAVRELAQRAGIDPSPLQRPHLADPRAKLLEDFFELCRHELASDRGAHARAYLGHRGFLPDAIAASGFGLVPDSIKAADLLEAAGHRERAIAEAAVLADSRWPGRICGAWRDSSGKIGTLWARALTDTDVAGSRYLYLRGASRTDLPPYGLSDLLRLAPADRRDIALVEGLFDLHQLRMHGIENVAALGGTSLRPQTCELLHRLGIDSVTLCLDNDDTGRAATARAVENAARARHSPAVYVIEPAHLAHASDPDELVRQRGIPAWHQLLETRTCGIGWRAHQLADATHKSPPAARRAALARAGHWLGTLPPRLALEQEDAIQAIAHRCGYSPEAVSRSFRARFWNSDGRQHEPPRPSGSERVLERER